MRKRLQTLDQHAKCGELEDITCRVCDAIVRNLKRAGLDPQLAGCLRESIGIILSNEVKKNHASFVTSIYPAPCSAPNFSVRDNDTSHLPSGKGRLQPESTSTQRIDPEAELDSLTDRLLDPLASLIDTVSLRQRIWLSTRSALKRALNTNTINAVSQSLNQRNENLA